MKCLILAAGYATRLYPLTENFPKSLLKVGNKAIIDWLVDDLKATTDIDEFIVVSNHKFAEHFEEWRRNKLKQCAAQDRDMAPAAEVNSDGGADGCGRASCSAGSDDGNGDKGSTGGAVTVPTVQVFGDAEGCDGSGSAGSAGVSSDRGSGSATGADACKDISSAVSTGSGGGRAGDCGDSCSASGIGSNAGGCGGSGRMGSTGSSGAGSADSSVNDSTGAGSGSRADASGIKKSGPYRITVLDDGSTSNESRLGAVKDIELAVKEIGLEDDLIVMAGDNVMDFSLSGFVSFAGKKNTSCVMCHEENELKKQQKTAIITLDGDDMITSYEEKPVAPKGNLAVPPFYVYRNRDVKRIGEALKEGCGYDAPGSFAAWLSRKTPMHAYRMPGRRYDIGDVESYEYVKSVFAGR